MLGHSRDIVPGSPGLRADSPSAHDKPQRLQVAVVRGPQSRRHAVLIRCVQLLPCRLLQHVQVAVTGRPVEPVVHGGALGFDGPAHWSEFGSMEDRGGVGVVRTGTGLSELTGWLLRSKRGVLVVKEGRGYAALTTPPAFE